jgi:hypothetical protein
MHALFSQSEFVPQRVLQSPQAFSFHSMSMQLLVPQSSVPRGHWQVPLMQSPEQQPNPFGHESPRNPQHESPSHEPLQHSSAMLRVQYVPAARHETPVPPLLMVPPLLVEPPVLIEPPRFAPPPVFVEPPRFPPPPLLVVPPRFPPPPLLVVPPLFPSPPLLIAPAPASPPSVIPPLPLEAPPVACFSPLPSSSPPLHAIHANGVSAKIPQKRKCRIL